MSFTGRIQIILIPYCWRLNVLNFPLPEQTWNVILVTLAGGRQPENERSSFRKLRLRFSVLSFPLVVFSTILKTSNRLLSHSDGELESWDGALIGGAEERLWKDDPLEVASCFQTVSQLCYPLWTLKNLQATSSIFGDLAMGLQVKILQINSNLPHLTELYSLFPGGTNQSDCNID